MLKLQVMILQRTTSSIMQIDDSSSVSRTYLCVWLCSGKPSIECRGCTLAAFIAGGQESGV